MWHVWCQSLTYCVLFVSTVCCLLDNPHASYLQLLGNTTLAITPDTFTVVSLSWPVQVKDWADYIVTHNTVIVWELWDSCCQLTLVHCLPECNVGWCWALDLLIDWSCTAHQKCAWASTSTLHEVLYAWVVYVYVFNILFSVCHSNLYNAWHWVRLASSSIHGAVFVHTECTVM